MVEQTSTLNTYKNSLVSYGPNLDPETNKLLGCTLIIEMPSRKKLFAFLEKLPLNNNYGFKLVDIKVWENYWARGSAVKEEVEYIKF